MEGALDRSLAGHDVDGVLSSSTAGRARAADEIAVVEDASFDGVTVGLRVNQNVHAPFFCVVDVFDVASGDLSLPGKVNN